MSQSSPHKSYVTSTASPFISLAKARENLLRDLDEAVPEVKTKFFFDNLLPPCPKRRTVQTVIRALRQHLVQKHPGGPSTWRDWGPPSDSTKHEDDVFKPFADLVKTIQNANDVTTPPLIQFKCNPASSLSCHTRMNTSKPDCYGVLSGAQLETDPRTGKEQPRWLDVAVPGEFKKGHSERERNDVSVPSTRFVPCSWSLLAI